MVFCLSVDFTALSTKMWQKSNLHPFLVRALGFGVYNRLEKGANLTPAL